MRCGCLSLFGEEVEEDALSEDGRGGSGEGCIEDVVEVDAAGELDDCCLNDEGEGRVGEGEVAIRELAEGDAIAAVEEVAEVPEDGYVGVLPEGDGGGGDEEDEGARSCLARGWSGLGLLLMD